MYVGFFIDHWQQFSCC
uniref:Uncharacterized protein n=1 Tax=Anguilla anguilla TaxID=7936 RepID=A0A0E9TF58_ANGAN